MINDYRYEKGEYKKSEETFQIIILKRIASHTTKSSVSDPHQTMRIRIRVWIRVRKKGQNKTTNVTFLQLFKEFAITIKKINFKNVIFFFFLQNKEASRNMDFIYLFIY